MTNLSQQNSSISHKEWGWVLFTAVMLGLLLLVPYFLGHLSAQSGTVYTGLIMNPEDAQTYWGKMLQGFNGKWLYTIPFTPEVHDGALVGIFYVWLGQIGRWLGMSLTAVWHTARFIADILLFLTIFAFISVFTQNRRTRWTAYLLTLFGSGLGWLLFLFGAAYWLDAFPVDFKQPGAHIFFTAMTFPHITIGTACILISMWAFQQLAVSHQHSAISIQHSAVSHQHSVLSPQHAVLSPQHAVLSSQHAVLSPQHSVLNFTIHNSLFIILLANFSNLLLAIAYPFLLYIVIGTAVLTWLTLSIQSRAILWKQAGLLAVTCILPAPLYLYYAYTLQTNAVFAAWDAQAATPSAPWPHYLIAFGPYLMLAALLWWKRPLQRRQFTILWCWLLVVALLLYAPLNPQRRFLQGVHVPLSILTVICLLDIVIPALTRTRLWQQIVALPRYETPKMIRLLLLLFLLIMSMSNLYLWSDVVRTAVFVQPDPLFRPTDEIAAAGWLRENIPTSAILLGDMQTGNLVAARSGQRVMLGHWAETVDYAQKQTIVDQFFNGSTDDTWRQAQLAQFRINYIWHGPREKQLGTFDPAQTDYLKPIFANNSITIYEVVP